MLVELICWCKVFYVFFYYIFCFKCLIVKCNEVIYVDYSYGNKGNLIKMYMKLYY